MQTRPQHVGVQQRFARPGGGDDDVRSLDGRPRGGHGPAERRGAVRVEVVGVHLVDRPQGAQGPERGPALGAGADHGDRPRVLRCEHVGGQRGGQAGAPGGDGGGVQQRQQFAVGQ